MSRLLLILALLSTACTVDDLSPQARDSGSRADGATVDSATRADGSVRDLAARDAGSKDAVAIEDASIADGAATDVGQLTRCHSKQPCGPTDYCLAKKTGCPTLLVPGNCVARPTQCGRPAPGDEVCGCDGNNYGSACLANSVGVSVSTQGACSTLPKP